MNQENNKTLQEIVSPLLSWYKHHARILPWRETNDPYAIWISEIMLQQTRVEAVIPYFQRWLAAFPTLPALASASIDDVLKQWEGLGYYSRAKNIHKTANIVVEQYGGTLPGDFDALTKLPGIGTYTAGAIGSISFHLPVPCVDGNVLRVVARLTASTDNVSKTATKRAMTSLIQNIIPGALPGNFNQALMELGATVCIPNGTPLCEACPLAFCCKAYLHKNQLSFPIKTVKKKRKIEILTVFVIVHHGKVAIRKRPEKGLLAGLWEFPYILEKPGQVQGLAVLEHIGIPKEQIMALKKAKHIFTHIEWHMSGFLVMDQNYNAIKTNQNKKNEVTPDYSKKNEAFTLNPLIINEILGEVHWIHIDTIKNELTLPAAWKTYWNELISHYHKSNSGII